MKAPRLPLALLIALPLAIPAAAAAQGTPGVRATSCLACHGDADLFEGEALAIAQHYAGDVHAEAGLSCHDCHGGNPDPALAEDLDLAMDPAWEANPYRGAPGRTEVPGFCGECHSDPVYMRRFKPDTRVDQEREYWTSRHGEALAAGDLKVANCVDCHGVHDILRPSDPDSTVYPTRVAETCRGCHESAEHMAGYTLPNGRPLPVDQYARWRRSVHAAGLLEREDLSAPTCNDCHGNHGAAPPGLHSVTFVCGQCHGREAGLFRASPKRDAYELHGELLAEAGEEGCAACHEAPQASVREIHDFGECATCHDNHGVVRPTVALLSPLPETPCAICHEPGERVAGEIEEPERLVEDYARIKRELVEEAAAEGIEGEALFNRLVDRAQALPVHTLAGEQPNGSPRLRPEFARLFDKFRIGKTYYTYLDPATGEETRAPVLRCGSCHALDPEAESAGAGVSAEMLGRMRDLTLLTARAERLILTARRGGVETRAALADLDQAVDAQIGLEVLVHTFSAAPDGDFMKQYVSGLTHARAALSAASDSLDELAFRRRGLVVALVVILAVLVGLGLKIRQVSEREGEAQRADERA